MITVQRRGAGTGAGRIWRHIAAVLSLDTGQVALIEYRLLDRENE